VRVVFNKEIDELINSFNVIEEIEKNVQKAEENVDLIMQHLSKLGF
jgi:hypothetical protein